MKMLVGTRLTPMERTSLAEVAEANDRSMSREVRRAILQYLERQLVPKVNDP